MWASIWVYHSFLAAAISLCKNMWPTILKIKIPCIQSEGSTWPQRIFWVCREWRWRRDFSFSSCFQCVLSKFSLSSHDVNTMFSSSSHTVPNNFSWFSQYVLQVPIVFPNTFPRAPNFLSHMVWQMLSFFQLSILLSKEVWFIFWHWDLQNHHVLNCILGIFGKLLTSKVHWLGFLVFGLTM